MGAAGWLGKVALKELLKLSPQIMETASQVYRSMKKRQAESALEGESPTKPLAQRLEELEQFHAQQAEVIAALAREVEALTRVADSLSRRLSTALVLGAAGALGVLLLLIFR